MIAQRPLPAAAVAGMTITATALASMAPASGAGLRYSSGRSVCAASRNSGSSWSTSWSGV